MAAYDVSYQPGVFYHLMTEQLDVNDRLPVNGLDGQPLGHLWNRFLRELGDGSTDWESFRAVKLTISSPRASMLQRHLTMLVNRGVDSAIKDRAKLVVLFSSLLHHVKIFLTGVRDSGHSTLFDMLEQLPHASRTIDGDVRVLNFREIAFVNSDVGNPLIEYPLNKMEGFIFVFLNTKESDLHEQTNSFSELLDTNKEIHADEWLILGNDVDLPGDKNLVGLMSKLDNVALKHGLVMSWPKRKVCATNGRWLCDGLHLIINRIVNKQNDIMSSTRFQRKFLTCSYHQVTDDDCLHAIVVAQEELEFIATMEGYCYPPYLTELKEVLSNLEEKKNVSLKNKSFNANEVIHLLEETLDSVATITDHPYYPVRD